MTDVPPPPPPANYGGGVPQPALPQPLISYWKKCVLENYANFQGRARRSEFWWFALSNVVVFFTFFVVGAIIKPLIFLVFIYWLAMLVPYLAVAVRRLHDTDKSGWFYFIALIPFVGGIILLVFFVLDSTRGTNQWGTSEKYPAG